VNNDPKQHWIEGLFLRKREAWTYQPSQEEHLGESGPKDAATPPEKITIQVFFITEIF
jgi:hypothetical protein